MTHKTFDVVMESNGVYYATYLGCWFVSATYSVDDESLAVLVESSVGAIGTATVYLGEVPKDCAYIDVNNFPEIVGVIERLGVAKHTGIYTKSGFVEYPLYKFNREKLSEYERGGNE